MFCLLSSIEFRRNDKEDGFICVIAMMMMIWWLSCNTATWPWDYPERRTVAISNAVTHNQDNYDLIDDRSPGAMKIRWAWKRKLEEGYSENIVFVN